MLPSLQKRIKGLNNLKRVKKVERFQTDGRVMQKIITGSLCLYFASVHRGTRFLPDVPFDAGKGIFKARANIFRKRLSFFRKFFPIH